MSHNDNKNLELISLIWLDSMADATQENRETQDKLRSIINHLRTFDNCQQCEHHIKSVIDDKQDKIILIVSGRLGQEIIEKVYYLKQIISIFVFCFDKERSESWAKPYKKIRGVFVGINDLLHAIDIDRKSQEYKLNEPLNLLINKDKIIPLLLRIDSSLIDKKSLLKICSKEYQGNLTEMENIQDFEHLYSTLNSLDWFFNETFLYRLLIKALHVFNIEIIFLLRFFLQDINQKLKNCLIVTETVYRALLMTNDQIEFINKSINENILRFDSFIIANQNKEQVLSSLKNTSNTHNLNRVVFEIDSNQIGRKYKEFIIFPITTYFHITSIEIDSEQIRFIKIKVFNSDKSNENKTKNPFELAHLLRHIGQLDQSEKLFYLLLDQYPLLNYQCYDGLGRIAQDKGLYELSLDFYLKSLETIPFEKRAHTLNNIGCAYDYLEDYENALRYYSEALSLMKKDLDQAMCLSNIGITYAKHEQYQQALQCFEQALSIRRKHLSENHVDIGISYTNLGVIWSSIGELDQALEALQLALKSFLPSNFEIFRATVYQNMAKVYQDKNQFDRSLKFYQDAAKIFQQYRPQDHPNLLHMQQQIKLLKNEL